MPVICPINFDWKARLIYLSGGAVLLALALWKSSLGAGIAGGLVLFEGILGR